MNLPGPETQATTTRMTLIEHLVILAATAVIVAAILQAAPLQSANDRSRWATVWSLVERGTFQIDEIDQVRAWSTIDKVRYRTSKSEPWHFYSSKPPLLSTIVAGLYTVEKATLGYGLFRDTAFVSRLLLLIVNAVPFYCAMRSLRSCLQLSTDSMTVRMFVLSVAGFASILNPYLTTLNNHTPAVACAMLSITAAARMLAGRGSSICNLMSLGFFSSLTCCFELPAAQLGVLAFLAAWTLHRQKALLWFVPAALIPLAAFFVTNWLATGGVRPFYATYGTDTYVYEHNGIPSYWTNPRDLDANVESPGVYLFHCLLGHHGLLSMTPVLSVAMVGWWFSLFATVQRSQRLLILAGALMTLVTLGFYLTRTQNYNYGGNSVGLRWMMWLTPFWWIAMVPAMERCSRRSFQTVACVLLFASMVSVGWSMNRPWRPSWLYEQMETAGWINYRSKTAPFEPKRTSVLTSVPQESGASATWRSHSGRRLTLTIADLPDASADEIPVAVELDGQQVRLAINRQKLSSGRPVEETVTAGKTNSESLVDQIRSLLRGLPESRSFNAGGPTWIPSRANPATAWKVERAAARVLVQDAIFGPCWYRCDVLYCDQLPFGVLQWKTTVTSDATGDVLNAETWVSEDY